MQLIKQGSYCFAIFKKKVEEVFVALVREHPLVNILFLVTQSNILHNINILLQRAGWFPVGFFYGTFIFYLDVLVDTIFWVLFSSNILTPLPGPRSIKKEEIRPRQAFINKSEIQKCQNCLKLGQ